MDGNTINIIWGACVSVGVIAAYFLIHYLIIRFNLSKAVNEAIDNAEQIGIKGKEKMQQAIDYLYNLIPAVFKAFIKKPWIEGLIQKAFDKMEDYAKKQLARKTVT